MGFEWQTGDEDATPWREERPTFRYRSPRWRWYVLGAIALIVAGIITWRLAEQRVAASSEQMRADVRASHELAQRAALLSDAELLRTVLSGRDESWTDTQRRLVAEGYAYTAAARLLFLEPVGEPQERALTLDPDLRSAELVLAQRYTPAAGSLLEEPVVLEHTVVFRRGSNRWLLAPPEGDYWGPQRSTRENQVVVLFPERDEVLARRLAGDLAADVEALCGLQSGRCPAGLVVTLTLEPDPESLLDFSDGAQMLSSGETLTLPAPSLLGVPQDETAYGALHNVYTRYMLSALAPQLANWDCCDRVVFWQALLQARLSEVGLAPPLLTAADSVGALELVGDVERFFVDLSQKWQSQRPVGLHTPLPLDVRVLLAFLLAQDQTAQNMQLSLNQTTAFHRWWSSFTSFAPTDRAEVRPALVSFVYQHYDPPPLPEGLALPAADLILACGETRQSVWRYHLDARTWTEELVLGPDQFATLVTDEERYFVASLNFGVGSEESSLRLSLWRVEPGEPPVEMSGDLGEAWLPLAKHGPVVPAAFFDPASRGEPVFGAVDVSSCDENGCAREDAPGLVIPSPGGANELASRALLGAPDLYLRPRGGEWKQLDAQGVAPFWIDDNTFAFLESPATGSEPVAMPGFRLFVQTLDNQTALLVEARNPLLPGAPDVLLNGAGAFYHAGSDTIYLLGADRNGSRTSLLAVPRPAGGSWLVPEPATPELAASVDGSAGPGLVPLTTHERWLVVMLSPPRSQFPVLWLVDLAGQYPAWTSGTTADVWLLPTHDWSPDGEWLAWLSEGALRLAAPAYRDASGEPYQLLIPHEQQVCSSLAWLQR